MVMVNRIITAREEEELSRYVKQRLSRTRSGHPFIREPDGPPQPPLLPPSALKKAGQPSPKSPRDKVTFAEFRNEVFTTDNEKVVRETDPTTANNGILKETAANHHHHKNGGGAVTFSSANNVLPPPPPYTAPSIPQISICEPSSSASEKDTSLEDSLEEDARALKDSLESAANSDIGEPPSPTTETQGIGISHFQKSRFSKMNIWGNNFYNTFVNACMICVVYRARPDIVGIVGRYIPLAILRVKSLNVEYFAPLSSFK